MRLVWTADWVEPGDKWMIAAITQGWSPSSTYQQLLTQVWVPNNISKCRMEPLKLSIRGDVKKKNSIFKDIVQIGGGEVNPMSKIWKEMNFWQKLEREGVTKHIVKNRSTLFCMIYYSVYTPVP